MMSDSLMDQIEDGVLLQKRANVAIVILSTLNAFMGSLAALKVIVALRTVNTVGWYWAFVGVGGLTMGTCGIWATHNIGMAAISYESTASSDEQKTFVVAQVEPVQMVAAAFVSAIICSLGIHVVAHHEIPGRLTVTNFAMAKASLILGIAAFTLHYTAMDSQQGHFRMEFNLQIVLLSFIVGLIAAFGSLWIIFHSNQQSSVLKNLFGAAGLAGAWILMHYVGIQSATYYYSSSPRVPALSAWSPFVVELKGFWTTIASNIVTVFAQVLLGYYEKLRAGAIMEFVKEFIHMEAGADRISDHMIQVLRKLHEYDETLAEIEDECFSREMIQKLGLKRVSRSNKDAYVPVSAAEVFPMATP